MRKQYTVILYPKPNLSGAMIVSIGYPVRSLIKMILSRQGAKKTVAGGRLTNFAQMLRGGEVGMKEYIMIKETGNAPITVVELVRCKDCKYWSAERINDFNKCRRWINVGVKNFATMGDWFCADGKRR